MTDYLEQIRSRYGEVDTSAKHIELRTETNAAGVVRWMLEASDEHSQFWFELSLRPSPGGYTEDRQARFFAAIGGLIEEHFGLRLEVTGDHDERRLALDVDDVQPSMTLDTLESAFGHLSTIIHDIAAGREPFLALAERDDALTRGDAPPDLSKRTFETADTPPKAASQDRSGAASSPESPSVPATSRGTSAPTSESSAPALEASAPTVSERDGMRWLGADDASSTQSVAWALGTAADDGQTTLRLLFGVDALPAGRSTADLGAALCATTLARRFDIEFRPVTNPVFEHDGVSKRSYAVVLDGDTARDHAVIGDEIAHFMQTTVTFIHGGLGLADVLRFPAASASTPAESPSARAETRSSAPPDPGPPRPEPPRPEPAPGSAFDVYIQHAGYDTVRMRQMLGILLSIDVIQATDLIDAIPCLLMNDVSRARAQEITNLVKRAGGKAAISPVGVAPDFLKQGR